MRRHWPPAACALPAALALAACDAGGRRPAATGETAGAAASSFASLLADSAAADSAAFASLPPRLRPVLDLRPELTEATLADTTRARCQPTGDTASSELRHRLHLTLADRRPGVKLPDHRIAVLFVRADRATGAIERVELVERWTTGVQRGFIWDREAGDTKSLEWAAGSSVPEVSAVPPQLPAARAVRALGRRLAVLPCAGPRARAG